MSYNFDEIISRRHTNSVNYEGWRPYIFRNDPNISFPIPDDKFIRLWIADMDFATPAVITNAIRERLDKKILGYTSQFDPDYLEVLKNWFQRRYNWTINTDHLVFAPGVVPALIRLVTLLTSPDENMLITTPSYTPFKMAGDLNNRKVFYSPLQNNAGYYSMNLADIEAQLADPTKNIRLFVLCNPHNPTGRVWTKEELMAIGQLCLSKNVWIISDEIHCDLLRKEQTHTPLATLFPSYEKVVTCTAPTKTFNLAGILHSHIFIPHQQIRESWQKRYWEMQNPLSIAATKAAYENGDHWLEALKLYLDDNLGLLQQMLQEDLPKAVYQVPEATYLAWVDVSAYSTDIEAVERLSTYFARKAGVLVEGGDMFVDNGKGHIRINVACPRAVLQEGVTRLIAAIGNEC
ncbi:MAG TPA: PatB family C-S lyase [Flavihumibacter sp.]|nr:PatB family C-S lyase [Flavihumibacter sp.]